MTSISCQFRKAAFRKCRLLKRLKLTITMIAKTNGDFESKPGYNRCYGRSALGFLPSLTRHVSFLALRPRQQGRDSRGGPRIFCHGISPFRRYECNGLFSTAIWLETPQNRRTVPRESEFASLRARDSCKSFNEPLATISPYGCDILDE
jgi:hypothetical protein